MSVSIFGSCICNFSIFKKNCNHRKEKVENSEIGRKYTHFLTDKISEDISNRDREVFEYEGSMDNFHIKGNYVLFRKDSLFYKLEYTNKKLYISEGVNSLNMGSRTALGEYENLEFKRMDRLFLIIIKNGKDEEVKIINFM